MMPAEYAALGQPGGPQPFTLEDLVSIATLVGGIFGNGGGDQLYNAVLYENLAQRFGAEHDVVGGSPTVITQAKKKKAAKKKKTKASTKKAKATQATAGHRKQGVKKKPKKHKAKKKQAAADHSGFATFLSFDDPNDPEAPTTVARHRVPVPDAARAQQGGGQTIALPDPGSVSWPTRSSAAPRQPAQARAGRTPPASGRSGVGARARRPTPAPGCSPFPRVDVQRAAGQRQGLGQRPPAGRDGPAGLLLRARRS